ncbi:MAG TPA: hypothetical protein VNI55_11940 [Gaiellaceae bacterium]|nr:hypothetical protein [Gaiellaceae bacterium]
MTSLLGKQLADISRVRAAYVTAMPPGSVLLVADGISKGSERYRELLALHEEHGLVADAQTVRAVWDPYGLNREVLLGFRESGASRVPVMLDNALTAFTRRFS